MEEEASPKPKSIDCGVSQSFVCASLSYSDLLLLLLLIFISISIDGEDDDWIPTRVRPLTA